MGLNAWIVYEMYSKNLYNISIELLLGWIILYAIKVLLLPLIMIKYQNKLYGTHLLHDTAYIKKSLGVMYL